MSFEELGNKCQVPTPVQQPSKALSHKLNPLEKLIILPYWKELAVDAGFPVEQLNETDKEILDLFHRVVIKGRGWGPKDRLRDKRDCIRLIPSKLTNKGQKKSIRTYQRSIHRLSTLGLINEVGICADQTREYSPGWWFVSSKNEAITVWKRAANIFSLVLDMARRRRTSYAPKSDHCRTDDAPPVPKEGDSKKRRNEP